MKKERNIPNRTGETADPPCPEACAKLLAEWFARRARDLPWRGIQDPYGIWISEVMLQQTRVPVVRERWEAFLARFPSPRELAASDDDSLLAAWEGLGYYRRVRQLREAARTLVERHGGRLPEEPEAFAELPGVGPYTKGAVYSLAFDLPLPAIDGNAERVIARLLALEEPARKKPGRQRIEAFVLAMLRHRSPRVINQALMDLGAGPCSPKNPECHLCPLQSPCRARQEGTSSLFPVLPPRPRPTPVETHLLLALHGSCFLGRRIPKGEVNQGQIGLPGLGLPLPQKRSLEEYIRENLGAGAQAGPPLGSFNHSITRYKITVHVHPLQLHGPVQEPFAWFPRNGSLPLSTVTRKTLARFQQSLEQGGGSRA